MLLKFGNQKKVIGEIIKVARQVHGLGQIELAKKVGITQGYLSKVEAGRIAPSSIDWYNITSTLEFSSDSLVWGYPDFFCPLDPIAVIAQRAKFPKELVDPDLRIRLSFFYPIMAHLETAYGGSLFQKRFNKFLEALKLSTCSLRLSLICVNEIFMNAFVEYLFSTENIEKVLINEIATNSVNPMSWAREFINSKERISPAIKIQRLLTVLSDQLSGLQWTFQQDSTQNASQLDLSYKSSFNNLKINELLLPYTASRLLPMIHQCTDDKRAQISQLNENRCRIIWR